MSAMRGDYDLIIVGAGLVGSALALSLAMGTHSRHLRIALVEAGGEPKRFEGDAFDPRVVALTPESQSLLERLGCWSAIAAERVCPYRDMEVWDGAGSGEIHFSCEDLHQDNLGHIVENSLLVRVLRQRLAECDVIRLQPTKVEGLERENGSALVCLSLDSGTHVRAPLVIAADGAHSRIRTLAGFSTREWAYDQSAIVTTIRTEKPHGYTARQRFMPTGPLALLPLRCLSEAGRGQRREWNTHYCSIVWSADKGLADELMALKDEDFCTRLGRDFEYRLGQVTGTAERHCLPLHQRHARQYTQTGLALVGDAAHSIHPLAGQGVNLGLRDAAVLFEEVERALGRGLPVGEPSLLRRYQRRRVGDNLGMMGVMEGFKRLFGHSKPELTWLRNAGMNGLDKLPLLKNVIARRAMGHHR